MTKRIWCRYLCKLTSFLDLIRDFVALDCCLSQTLQNLFPSLSILKLWFGALQKWLQEPSWYLTSPNSSTVCTVLPLQSSFAEPNNDNDGYFWYPVSYEPKALVKKKSYFFNNCIVPFGWLYGKFGLLSLGKASCCRALLPNLQCMLGVLVFP